eukprot:c5821_g1_i1.p1 GENE.c5821_g1_i1~~c5821_g1_i1.p1  ORF type:complete len:242 (+),score=41.05 c5821_g1_i1:65-727(+)
MLTPPSSYNQDGQQLNFMQFGQDDFGPTQGFAQVPPPNFGNSSTGDDFENEPPLLEELGINFEHIIANTKSVLNPRRSVDREMLQDADLAGPFCICLALGFSLLLSGKVHGFGFIYGVGSIGCVSMYLLLMLMSDLPVDMYRTVSVLGYGLLPLVILALIAPFISLQSSFGLVVSALCILWATYTAARFFVTVLDMHNQQPLVAYPIFLFYTTFAIITVF